MKLKKLVKKKLVKDLLIILIILISSFLTWKHILTIQIQGEGFFYFDQQIAFSRIPTKLGDYLPLPSDFFAKFSFYFLPFLFQDRIRQYLAFLLITKLAIDVLAYLMVKELTQDRKIAFFSALIFGLSFTGNYDMYSSGGYQYFIQRGILLLPLLLSFIFLSRFLHKRFLTSYLLSLILFTLSIVMGYFATWFSPAFLLYPIACGVIDFRKNLKHLLKSIFIAFPYLLIDWFLIKADPVTTASREPLLKYILHLKLVLTGVLQQLSVITFPFLWDIPAWYREIMLFLYRYEIFIPSLNVAKEAIVPYAQIITAVVYSVICLHLWQRFPKTRALLITILTSAISMFVFNQYLSVEPLKTFSSLRYFYYPSVIISIFWGIYFSLILITKNKTRQLIFLGVFLLWLSHNNHLIRASSKEDRWKHQANQETIQTIKEMSPILQSKPYHVYLASTLGPYGVYFTQRFYAHPKSKFSSELPELKELLKENIRPEEIYVFRFDYPTRRLINETENYRKQLSLMAKEQRASPYKY